MKIPTAKLTNNAVKMPKVRLSFATGSAAAARYHNAPMARIPAAVGLNMRGPRHRTYEPAMASGPHLKGIRLGAMMARPKAVQPKEARWLPNPAQLESRFSPDEE